jgi:hypothetical protein
MLEQHDADVLPRCRRLGHEITFGYCRRENFGKPCRLILDCWWERFDVRGFLHAHLTAEAISQLEGTAVAPPPPKMQSLLDLIQQTKKRLETKDPEPPRPTDPQAN